MAASRAEAVVVWARQRDPRSGSAEKNESWWWQDVLGHRFGRSAWTMEFDVHPPGGSPYRLQCEVKVPNRLFKIRYVSRGRPYFRPGLALPVLVDDRDPEDVSVDWDAFASRGGVAELFAHEESVVDSVREFVRDIRSKPAAPAPDVPRPTPATHPPVEGVDYDRWVEAVLSVQRRMSPEALETHYQAHGFPAGRGDAISAVWYERVATDPAVHAWYLHDQARR